MISLVLKFVTFSGLCLSACAAQTPTLAVEKPAAVTKSVVEHATISPGASVSLTPSLEESMSVNTYNRVDLKFNEFYTDGLMNVRVVPGKGLSIFGGNAERDFDMSSTSLHELSVDVLAETDGLYFLNVFAESKGQVRTFSISLNIGAVTEEMRKSAVPENGELRDGIRVLEAEETIR